MTAYNFDPDIQWGYFFYYRRMESLESGCNKHNRNHSGKFRIKAELSESVQFFLSP